MTHARDTEQFFDKVQEIMFDAGELDYQSFTEIGLACGLLREERYEPEGKHADLTIEGDVEEGDVIYVVVKP